MIWRQQIVGARGVTFSIKMIGVGWGTVKAMSYPARIFMARRARVLMKVRQLVVPVIEDGEPIKAWIIDDTSYPKQGNHNAEPFPERPPEPRSGH